MIKPEMPNGRSNGVIIPDAFKQDSIYGRVTHVGDSVDDIEVGDRVVYHQQAGAKIELEGEELLLIRDHDIFGVLE